MPLLEDCISYFIFKEDFMHNITKKDILDTFIIINFISRDKELAQKHSAYIGNMPLIEKKKINEIITKLGYKPGYIGSCYYLKNEVVDNVSFDIKFSVSHGYVDNIWCIYDEGELVYGCSWAKLEKTLTNNRNFSIGCPTFNSYEELEEILSYIFKIYEDFKETLCKEKGISYR